ncbi:MAG: ABC-F family ATP-binding cassette domain-containing protein [Actinobacteria bacterium]|nr:ABC-F family ATP-binding cassette domain-containing protein [Actinomycetota bacterium]
MAHLLGAEELHLEFPTRIVFDSVSLGIDEGDRIGIVGRNGDGKSSLLGMLSGRVTPDTGRVTRRSGVRMGVLEQADTLDADATVGEVVVGDRAEHEWAGDARIRDVIAGLVPDLPWDAEISTLSGGQRRRVALAALLVGDWDILALDEPTNHLDLEGVAWLADHLKRRWAKNAGGLLLITHDRWLLDEVSTSTWEVHDRIVEPFEGGYAAYVLQRVERDRRAAVSAARRANLMRKELAWLRRGPPARTSKPKFRIEAANQLIADVPPPRDQVQLSRLAVARLGKQVIDLLDVSVSFGEREVLREVDWRIAPGERTAIMGANGAGKSTLLGLIAGTVEPSSGRVKRGKTVRVGVLDQQFRELVDIADERVRDVLARAKSSYVVDGRELTPAQLLERLGFSNAHLSARVGELSGGQKRRLQLLLVLLSEPNLIVLDEPSNDVDTDMLAAMEDLLDTWPGTLIVVSHDRYLCERVTDQQYAVIDGRLRHLPGGVAEYLSLRQGQPSRPASARDRVARDVDAPAVPGGPGESRGSGGGDAGRKGAADADPAPSDLTGSQRRAIQKEAASIERRLDKFAAEVADLHRRMAVHDQTDYEELRRLGERLRAVESETADLEERWLELSELID